MYPMKTKQYETYVNHLPSVLYNKFQWFRGPGGRSQARHHQFEQRHQQRFFLVKGPGPVSRWLADAGFMMSMFFFFF